MFEHFFILDIFFYYIFFAVGDYFGKMILDAKELQDVQLHENVPDFHAAFRGP